MAAVCFFFIIIMIGEMVGFKIVPCIATQVKNSLNYVIPKYAI